MPSGDDDGLGPHLEERLRQELDRVRPAFSSPRYLAAKSRPTGWRFAPAALGVAVGAMVALTVYAGSPNPIVWTQHVVTVVRQAQTTPTPIATPEQHRSAATPTQEPPENHETPEPSQPPEQHESPEPSGGGGSGEGSSGGGTSDGGGSTSDTTSSSDGSHE